MYYIQPKKNLGHNRGVLYLEPISVYVQYIINTYVIDVVVFPIRSSHLQCINTAVTGRKLNLKRN